MTPIERLRALGRRHVELWKAAGRVWPKGRPIPETPPPGWAEGTIQRGPRKGQRTLRWVGGAGRGGAEEAAPRRVRRAPRPESASKFAMLDLSEAASVTWRGSAKSLVAQRFLGEGARGRDIAPVAVAWTGFSQEDIRGAKIKIDAYASKDGAYASMTVQVVMNSVGEDGEPHGASRRYIIDDLGRYAKHDNIVLPSTGDMQGPRLLGRAVANLSAAGFQAIHTQTSGWGPHYQPPGWKKRGWQHGAQNRKRPRTGYYAWPRFGFDREFSDDERKLIPRKLVGKGKRVSDLMKTAEGRAWWKDHGYGMSLSFDLSPDSLGRRVLSEYLEQKGITLEKARKPRRRGRRREEMPPELTPEDEAILDRIWDRLA